MENPAFLQNFIDGPKLPKIVLGVIGVAAIAAGAYFLLLAPIQTRIGVLQGRHAQLQTELNTARVQLAEVERFRREVAELEKRLAILKDRLPSEKETPGLYRALSTAAEQVGLGVSLFQPRDARPKDVVNEIPITVSAEGSYHQMGKFFERVATLPRVVTVGDFKMASGKGSKGSVKADLTLATYMYRTTPAPPPPRATPGGAPTGGAPAGGRS